MGFTMTEDWVHTYYGSQDSNQVQQAIGWLKRYGTDVPPDKYEEWGHWKHLVEYQVNTPDIVNQVFEKVRSQHVFTSELEAHAFINTLRVPMAASAYKEALEIVNPFSILELGVGGDSAISTSVFLSFLEKQPHRQMVSVDVNPLGMTWRRYSGVPFWSFVQEDSIFLLNNWTLPVDMVFIDTIHSYSHTKEELRLAESITDSILLDDATFEGNGFDPEPGGVKRAIEEWVPTNGCKWDKTFYGCGTVCLLEKRS